MEYKETFVKKQTVKTGIVEILPIFVFFFIIYCIFKLFEIYSGTKASDWSGINKSGYYLYIFFYYLFTIIFYLGIISVFGIFAPAVLMSMK